MQSDARVVKSGSMASNGQTSTHLPHATQVCATFRSVTRKKLFSENNAPVGQTYRHQNRGWRKPSTSTRANKASERTCPTCQAGIWCQSRANPVWMGVTKNAAARVNTGIAATYPANRTPLRLAASTAANR